mmetsp:Transcript_17532/g.42072  ORF Transcript_17532/g.42072 Transcript_17532/m.42072 type:complete len:278 (-) Transcript_17532:3531-4364(-)
MTTAASRTPLSRATVRAGWPPLLRQVSRAVAASWRAAVSFAMAAMRQAQSSDASPASLGMCSTSRVPASSDSAVLLGSTAADSGLGLRERSWHSSTMTHCRLFQRFGSSDRLPETSTVVRPAECIESLSPPDSSMLCWELNRMSPLLLPRCPGGCLEGLAPTGSTSTTGETSLTAETRTVSTGAGSLSCADSMATNPSATSSMGFGGESTRSPLPVCVPLGQSPWRAITQRMNSSTAVCSTSLPVTSAAFTMDAKALAAPWSLSSPSTASSMEALMA